MKKNLIKCETEQKQTEAWAIYSDNNLVADILKNKLVIIIYTDKKNAEHRKKELMPYYENLEIKKVNLNNIKC